MLLCLTCLVVGQSEDVETRKFGDPSINNRKTYVLTGVISDAVNYETIIGATVGKADGSDGTSTEIDGGYRLKLDRGKNLISISYIGYATRTIEVEIYQNATMNLSLSRETINIDEVVITDVAARDNIEDVASSVERLSIKELEAKSQLLGEVDVLRSIQSLSGVTSVGDRKSVV